MITTETGNSCKRDRGGEEEKGREGERSGDKRGGEMDWRGGKRDGREGWGGEGREVGTGREGSSCRREGERREVGGV